MKNNQVEQQKTAKNPTTNYPMDSTRLSASGA